MTGDAERQEVRRQVANRVPRTELKAFDISNIGVSEGDIRNEFATAVRGVTIDMALQTNKSVNVASVQDLAIKHGEAGGITLTALVLFDITTTPLEYVVHNPTTLLASNPRPYRPS